MANYSLVINSKFKPFSYQEMMSPVLLATQEHQKLEDAYGDLGIKSDIWKRRTEGTEKASALYSGFSSALEEAADELSQYGLTPASRQNMMKLRQRYASDITPLEEAWARKEADIKRQQDLSDKTGDRTVFTRKASTTSLDEYLNGTPEYHSVNLDTVMNEGMLGGQAISKRYFRTAEGRAFGGDYLNFTKVQGLSPAEAMEVLRRSGKYPEFENYIQNELAKVGATPGNSLYADIDRNAIENALMQGINLGITYNETPELKENWRAKENLSHAHALARQRASSGEDKETPPRYTTDAIFEGASGQQSPTSQRFKGVQATKVVDKNGKTSYNVSTALSRKYDIAAEKAKQEWKEYTAGKTKEELKELEDLYDKTGGKMPKVVGKSQTTVSWNDLFTGKAFAKTGAEREQVLRAARRGSNVNEAGYKMLQAALGGNPQEYGVSELPAGYGEYLIQRNKLGKALEAQKAEQDFIRKNQNRFTVYTGDSSNIGTNMQIGLAVENTQKMQQNYSKPINMAPNQQETLLGTWFKNSASGHFKFTDTKTGKVADGDKRKSLLSDDKEGTNISIVKDGKTTYLALTDQEGNRYRMSGSRNVDELNRTLTNVNNFLGDFSPEALKKVYNLTPRETAAISNGDFTPLQKFSYTGGTNYHGYVLRASDGDIIKVMTRGNQIIGMQSLSDELNGGKHRDAIINNIADNAFEDMLKSFSHTFSSKEN